MRRLAKRSTLQSILLCLAASHSLAAVPSLADRMDTAGASVASYDARDRLTTLDGESFEYSGRGRLQRRSVVSGLVGLVSALTDPCISSAERDEILGGALLGGYGGLKGGGRLLRSGASGGAVRSGLRTAPRNLSEKLALDEARAGGGRRIMQGKINDSKFPENVFAKMEHVHKNPDGTQTVIHYWKNLETGVREGYKFK